MGYKSDGKPSEVLNFAHLYARKWTLIIHAFSWVDRIGMLSIHFDNAKVKEELTWDMRVALSKEMFEACLK